MESKLSTLPTKPLDFPDILSASVRSYKPVVKAMAVFIVLLAITQGFEIYLSHLFESQVLKWIVLIVTGIVYVYFAACAFYQAYLALKVESHDVNKTAQIMLKRMPKLLIDIIIICGVVMLWQYAIYHIGMEWIGHPKSSPVRMLLFMLFFYFIPVIVAIGFYFYTIPLIVIEDTPLSKVFGRAQRLVGDKWLKGVSAYVGVGILYVLVWPGTLHAHFLFHYHVLILFNLVVYFVLLPVYCSLVNLLINDFKVRRNM